MAKQVKFGSLKTGTVFGYSPTDTRVDKKISPTKATFGLANAESVGSNGERAGIKTHVRNDKTVWID